MRIGKLVSPIVLLGTFAMGDAQALDKTYDITTCSQGTLTMVSKSKEMTVYSLETNGITFSNDADKTFDGSSAHCVGIGKVGMGDSIRQGYCKYLRPNGDTVVGEFKLVNKEKGVWTYLHGTGSSAGIKGGGTFERVTSAKPMRPGTFGSCTRATGNYTLP